MILINIQEKNNLLGIYSVITHESRIIVETKSTVEIELGQRVYFMCYNQSDKF
jgi:hypothetical protein